MKKFLIFIVTTLFLTPVSVASTGGWSTSKIPSTLHSVVGIAWSSSSECLVIGSQVSTGSVAINDKSVIMKSNDSGFSWTKVKSVDSVAFMDISSYKNYAIAVVGNVASGIQGGQNYKSTDSGLTWHAGTSVSGTSPKLFGVVIDQTYTATAVGISSGESAIFRSNVTTNFTSWTKVVSAVLTSSLNKQLNGVSTYDGQHFLVVGASRTVFSSNDGGATWLSLTFSVGEKCPVSATNLHSVHFKTANFAIIAGTQGCMLRQRNGAWDVVAASDAVLSNSLFQYHSVYIATNSIAFAADQTNKRILRTVDGGVTWFTEYQGTNKIYSVSAYDYGIAAAGQDVSSSGNILTRSQDPSSQPSSMPSRKPSMQPTNQPSGIPTTQPTVQPSEQPSSDPSTQPTQQPTTLPSMQPSHQPSALPTSQPTVQPSKQPSCQPSSAPTSQPSSSPSCQPSAQPSSSKPTNQPTGYLLDGNWTRNPLILGDAGYQLLEVKCADTINCVTVGYFYDQEVGHKYGVIARTTVGGVGNNSWTVVQLTPYLEYHALSFDVNYNVFVTVDQRGGVWRSENNGVTWTNPYNVTTGHLHASNYDTVLIKSICVGSVVADESGVFMVGQNKIYHNVRNYGSTLTQWHVTKVAEDSAGVVLNDVATYDGWYGIAVGNSGRSYFCDYRHAYYDTNCTETDTHTLTSSHLYNVAINSQGMTIAVAVDGTLLKYHLISTAYGATDRHWIKLSLKVAPWVAVDYGHVLQIMTNSVAYIADNNGNILVTRNGGSKWSNETDVANSGILCLTFYSSSVSVAINRYAGSFIKRPIPTSFPTSQPSSFPSTQPSGQPNMRPTGQPSRQPSIQPTRQPVMVPSTQPSKQPLGQPTSQPSRRPTVQPTSQPSLQPSSLPSSQPSMQPSSQPSAQPIGVPSSQPSFQPFNQPTTQPTQDPTSQPSGEPSFSPSKIPSEQPTSVPTLQPSAQPSTQPTQQPTGQPSRQPSAQPTAFPSMQPSMQPSRQPYSRPSTQPSRCPTTQPTMQPSGRPTNQPTRVPTIQPSSAPTRQPTSQPSRCPTNQPTGQPSRQPSSQPSAQPSRRPTVQPSCQPTNQPSSQPSRQPSSRPSIQPSQQPSSRPSAQPSSMPSCQPSAQPSMHPSCQPSSQPSLQPSSQPSIQPTFQPTVQPTKVPSCQPTSAPSSQPSRMPTNQPSSQPSRQPSGQPSRQPSNQPTNCPTVQPTGQPSSQPSSIPSLQPSVQPSFQPSDQPTGQPSNMPSLQPSSQPSIQPTNQPSGQPSRQPSDQPTVQPSRQPTGQPSRQPSNQPSAQPSRQPSGQPSRMPSTQPSCQPSRQPTMQPSQQPSCQPTAQPSRQPFSRPSAQPSRQPSAQPTMQPSVQPSIQPSVQPSAQPSYQPSQQPSALPSDQPTVQPSDNPSSQPSSLPTIQPSSWPSVQPTEKPSCQPSRCPSNQPSGQPSRRPTMQPSRQPTQQPSGQPTRQPSSQPTTQPSSQPSNQPTQKPSSQPSTQPSCQPSGIPSGQPSSQPSVQPTLQPSSQPTKIPTNQPSSQPSRQPTQQPTAQPSRQPSVQPSQQPTRQPTSQPSQQPSRQPTGQPTHSPSNQPSCQPSRQPSAQPSRQPSTQPTTQPSLQPFAQPSAMPTCQPSSQPSVQPTDQPSGQPSRRPSAQPSRQPSAQPSVSPTRQPTSQPSSQPSVQPSSKPSKQPTVQPTGQPSRTPSMQPTRQPFGHPTSQPSSLPSSQPSAQPSRQPSGQPSRRPTIQPSSQPSRIPSCQPSKQPVVRPSSQPSRTPTNQPSTQPVAQPSSQPSRQPSMQPTLQPRSVPTRMPSNQPSAIPTDQPSTFPSSRPSQQPSRQPSSRPSSQPSSLPSRQPTTIPTRQPSGQPSRSPTGQPTKMPSRQPTGQPSRRPSGQPSKQPSVQPSCQPSLQPFGQPTNQPSSQPNAMPSMQPSSLPSKSPSGVPSRQPTSQPSGQPLARPSRQPSTCPTSAPTVSPSSAAPTSVPTAQPMSHPTGQPSVSPTMAMMYGYSFEVSQGIQGTTRLRFLADSQAATAAIKNTVATVAPSVHTRDVTITSVADVASIGTSRRTEEMALQSLIMTEEAFSGILVVYTVKFVPTSSDNYDSSYKYSRITVALTDAVSNGVFNSTLRVNAKIFNAVSLLRGEVPKTNSLFSVGAVTPEQLRSPRPTSCPSSKPTGQPSSKPTSRPTSQPSVYPSVQPSSQPSAVPTSIPTLTVGTQYVHALAGLIKRHTPPHVSLKNVFYDVIARNDRVMDSCVQWTDFVEDTLAYTAIVGSKIITAVQFLQQEQLNTEPHIHRCINPSAANEIVATIVDRNRKGVTAIGTVKTVTCDGNNWRIATCGNNSMSPLSTSVAVCLNCVNPCVDKFCVSDDVAQSNTSISLLENANFSTGYFTLSPCVDANYDFSVCPVADGLARVLSVELEAQEGGVYAVFYSLVTLSISALFVTMYYERKVVKKHKKVKDSHLSTTVAGSVPVNEIDCVDIENSAMHRLSKVIPRSVRQQTALKESMLNNLVSIFNYTYFKPQLVILNREFETHSVTMLTPNSDVSVAQRVREGLFPFHYAFAAFHESLSTSRSLRIKYYILCFNRVVIVLFFMTVFFNAQFEADDGVCVEQNNEKDCLTYHTIFSHSTTTCRWIHDGGNAMSTTNDIDSPLYVAPCVWGNYVVSLDIYFRLLLVTTLVASAVRHLFHNDMIENFLFRSSASVYYSNILLAVLQMGINRHRLLFLRAQFRAVMRFCRSSGRILWSCLFSSQDTNNDISGSVKDNTSRKTLDDSPVVQVSELMTEVAVGANFASELRNEESTTPAPAALNVPNGDASRNSKSVKVAPEVLVNDNTISDSVAIQISGEGTVLLNEFKTNLFTYRATALTSEADCREFDLSWGLHADDGRLFAIDDERLAGGRCCAGRGCDAEILLAEEMLEVGAESVAMNIALMEWSAHRKAYVERKLKRKHFVVEPFKTSIGKGLFLLFLLDLVGRDSLVAMSLQRVLYDTLFFQNQPPTSSLVSKLYLSFLLVADCLFVFYCIQYTRQKPWAFMYVWLVLALLALLVDMVVIEGVELLWCKVIAPHLIDAEVSKALQVLVGLINNYRDVRQPTESSDVDSVSKTFPQEHSTAHQCRRHGHHHHRVELNTSGVSSGSKADKFSVAKYFAVSAAVCRVYHAIPHSVVVDSYRDYLPPAHLVALSGYDRRAYEMSRLVHHVDDHTAREVCLYTYRTITQSTKQGITQLLLWISARLPTQIQRILVSSWTVFIVFVLYCIVKLMLQNWVSGIIAVVLVGLLFVGVTVLTIRTLCPIGHTRSNRIADEMSAAQLQVLRRQQTDVAMRETLQKVLGVSNESTKDRSRGARDPTLHGDEKEAEGDEEYALSDSDRHDSAADSDDDDDDDDDEYGEVEDNYEDGDGYSVEERNGEMLGMKLTQHQQQHDVESGGGVLDFSIASPPQSHEMPSQQPYDMSDSDDDDDDKALAAGGNDHV